MSKTAEWLEGLRTAVLDDDQDRVILNCGLEGSGKTNTSYWIGKELDGSFGPKRMVFSGEAFMSLAVTLPPGSVIVLDEGIEALFGRDFGSQGNKAFAKFLIVCRERNLIIILNWPNIKFADTYTRDHRAHYFLLNKRPGQAILHRRRRADYPGAKSSWPKMWGLRDIPDCSKLYPEEWQEYLENKSELVRDYGAAGRKDRWTPPNHDVARLAKKFEILEQRG